MKARPLLFFLILDCLVTFSAQAQRGKDGSVVISSPNTIVNEYTILKANASAGSPTVKVFNSALDSSKRFPGKLSAGDLVMIIQMQGAKIGGNPADSSWGDVSAYNNCGLYEFREVSSVPDSITITFTCPLVNSYTDTGVVQVVRVPRYTSLTINSGASIICPAWHTPFAPEGGVIAIEVLGNTIINGSVNATGMGFRGGQAVNDPGTNHSINIYSTVQFNDGANKGESIAGFTQNYSLVGGQYGRGAPANGGGGGNSWNAGGGGGSNADNKNKYNGLGNPDTSKPGWKIAWNLEYNGFYKSASSGGGRGGYTWGNCGSNPLVDGPGNSSYGADDRSNVGGNGGRPLLYSSGHLFMGGGGGAGQEDNGTGTNGGSGGGIVFFTAFGTITGNGTILANGDSALPAQSPTPGGFMDGAGGGGGGGAIVIDAFGSVSGISASAFGGKGGNQNVGSDSAETEGPGGGGGGGYIALSIAGINTNISGGKNGLTTADCMADFAPNGATSGGYGDTARYSDYLILAPAVSVCDSNEPLTLAASIIGTASPGTSFTWYDSITGGKVLGTGSTYPVSGIKRTTVFYVGTCPGTYRVADTAIIRPKPLTLVTSSVPSSCKGDCDGQASVVVSPGGVTPYTYFWNTGATGATINEICAGIYTINVVDSNKCVGTDTVTVKAPNPADFIIPNVITPNGDGKNDNFEIKGFPTGDYSVTIYDRWGLEMFSSESSTTLWNGKTSKGAEVPSGVYYYIVKTSCGDSDFNGHGFVELLR